MMWLLSFSRQSRGRIARKNLSDDISKPRVMPVEVPKHLALDCFAPSPLNGERDGVRGENCPKTLHPLHASQAVHAFPAAHSRYGARESATPPKLYLEPKPCRSTDDSKIVAFVYCGISDKHPSPNLLPAVAENRVGCHPIRYYSALRHSRNPIYKDPFYAAGGICKRQIAGRAQYARVFSPHQWIFYAAPGRCERKSQEDMLIVPRTTIQGLSSFTPISKALICRASVGKDSHPSPCPLPVRGEGKKQPVFLRCNKILRCYGASFWKLQSFTR